MSREAVISKLKNHAQSTQQSVREFNQQHSAVSILQTFWITNTVVLEIDTDEVSIGNLTEVDHVQAVHENYEVQKLSQSASSGTPASGSVSTTGSHAQTTYGLDQINATQVWSQYGTRGEGVKVAVLDTGVDISHPDIELFSRNESDPTYPGGYAEFDPLSGGIIEGATPSDEDGHGTHVSGTVAGSNASGEYIGVAPNASLMHGKVLSLPGGGGTFAQILGGIQWAAVNDADVISMSLGTPADVPFSFLGESMQNVRAVGVVPVASAGNSGPGVSGYPGDLHNVISVGASTSDRTIADFSSSEVINTSERFPAAPESFPETYVVPDIAAPGAGVKSSVPGGYSHLSGTSMAAPHVSGTIALIESAANNNPSIDLVETALEETAQPANGLNQSNSSQAVRDGAGIIDAKAATDRVVTDRNVSARLGENLARHVEPGQNTTASFRISNADTVTVTLDSISTAAADDVSVFVNGQQASLGSPVNTSDNSTDGFTVTAQVNSTYERVGLNVAFETSNATTNRTTVPVGVTKVHPDPIVAGNGTDQFNSTAPITNATIFATPDTTIELTNGTYSGFVMGPDVAEGLTVTAANPGGVTIQGTGPVALFPDRTTLANLEIDVSGEVAVLGNASSLLNIQSHGPVVFSGVVGGTIADSTIQSDEIGLVVDGSENVLTERVSVEAESAIQVIGSANSVVRESTARGSAGSGVTVALSDNVVVRGNTIRGSNVSAGFTGAVASATNGFGLGGTSSTATATDIVEAQTVSLGDQTFTYGTFVPQAKGEYVTEEDKQRLQELRAEFLPDTSPEELDNMTNSERRDLISQVIKSGSAQALDNTSATSTDAGTLSHTEPGEPVPGPARFVGNDIQGEAVGVITSGGTEVLEGNRISNVSYPYYGVLVLGSQTIMTSNTVDNDVGTNLRTESGVNVQNGFATLLGNDITSRTAVQVSGEEALVQAYRNTLEGETAVRSAGPSSIVESSQNIIRGGIGHQADSGGMVIAENDQLATNVGVVQRGSGFVGAAFTDFTVPETAIQSQFGQVIAPYNWWGSERGPSAAQRADLVQYDPFLTAPPSETDLDVDSQIGGLDAADELQQFAIDLTLEPGEPTALSVPGPMEGTLSSMFPADFRGVAYQWDAQNDRWVQATADTELGALDAVLVIPSERARVVVEFEESNSQTSVPPTKSVSQGWNLIGAPAYSDAETAFGASSASPARIVNSFEQPRSQPFAPGEDFGVHTFGGDRAPRVSAMTGYWVYAEDNGSIAANVPPGVTATEFPERVVERTAEEPVR